MTPLQLELTRLIWKKEWSAWLIVKDNYWIILTLVWERQFDWDDDVYFYAPEHKEISHWFNNEEYTRKKWEIIGHPATLTDFHRWMNEKGVFFKQEDWNIRYYHNIEEIWIPMFYDSSKDLLEQSEETLTQIRDLIISNS